MVKFNIYLKAFLLSLSIFLIGLFIGIGLETYLASSWLNKASEIESSVQEMELEMLYFQNLNESYSCDFLTEIVRKTNNNLDVLAGQLSQYSEGNIIFTRQDIEGLKRRYTSLLIKDWMLQERIKRNCGTKIFTILYFYDREGCDNCLIQGNVLSSLKYSFTEKLMIFPIDIKVENSMKDVLLKRFNITIMPSLVIDEKVYSGINSKSTLNNMICSYLKENLTSCL